MERLWTSKDYVYANVVKTMGAIKIYRTCDNKIMFLDRLGVSFEKEGVFNHDFKSLGIGECMSIDAIIKWYKLYSLNFMKEKESEI